MLDYSYINDFYRKRYLYYGKIPQAIGWGSRLEQQKRFQALIKNFDKDILNRESIVDFGCGLAHFYSWLAERKLEKNYLGVDIVEEFISNNKNAYPDVAFLHTDQFMKIEEKYGFIVASGVFTLSWGDNHREKVKDMIKTLFNYCYIGFSFNMLNSCYSEFIKEYYYFNPYEIGEFCNKISNRLIIDCSYLPEDFTITLFH